MNTKSVGDISESYIIYKFLSLGWVVLRPVGDNQRYDCVIDKGNGFERVQIKTGRLINGTIKFNNVSYSNTSKIIKKNYVGQCDYFAVYCHILNKAYLIPIDKCALSETTLRINPPKNKQEKNVVWAKDFEI